MAVDGDAVVLVALGVAAGDGEGGAVDGERPEPGQEVVGVESGGIDPDAEVDPAVLGDEVDEPLTELGIAGGGFDHPQVRGGSLEVGIEEGGVVAVARRVDADADVGDWRLGADVGGPLAD